MIELQSRQEQEKVEEEERELMRQLKEKQVNNVHLNQTLLLLLTGTRKKTKRGRIGKIESTKRRGGEAERREQKVSPELSTQTY